MTVSSIRDIWLFAHNIIRSSRQLVNEGLKPLNLSSAEGNILLHLLTQDGVTGALRQDDLVEQLDVSRPAVSRALDSLEGKGYVTRDKDPEDRRVSRVLLTERARKTGPRIEEVYERVYAVATEVASQQEIDAFIDLFSRVSDSFSAARSKRKPQGRPK